jgi:chromosome segregation ATPase
MRRHAWLLLLVAACNVPRPDPRPVDPAAFPTEQNLLRATEALKDRLAQEQEHVDALQAQLARLKSDEETSYAAYLEVEKEYQLREKDRAGVEQDLAATEKQLAETQQKLQEAQAKLAAAQAQLADLVTKAQALLDTAAKLQAAITAGDKEALAAILAAIPPDWLAPKPPAPAPAPAPGGN